jgi:putative ABC transport system permease protein
MSDFRHALRQLRRSPRFTAVAVATLALAIGATVTLFGVVDAAFFRPLPFRDAERLVSVRGWLRPKSPGASVKPAEFVDYRARCRAFESLAATMPGPGSVTLTGGGEPERLRVLPVTANFFETVGVSPSLGRTFRPEEERVPAPEVAVLSHGLWSRRFGGRADVLGTTAVLDGETVRVVGVMPPGFELPAAADAWVPLPFLAPGMQSRSARFLRPIGRLRPGVTVEQAQAEIHAVAAQLEREHPADTAGWTLHLNPLREQLVGATRPVLRLLSGAVALVLLLACLNVSSLFLSRARRRQGEIAVRLALGAGRTDVIRLLVAEGVVLGTAGAAVGSALAWACLKLLATSAFPGVPRFAVQGPDARLVGVAAVLAVLTGIAVALLPALRLSAAARTPVQDSTRGVAGGRTRRLQSGLAVSQLALALVILAGTGLMLRSLGRLLATPLGFDPQNVLSVSISMPPASYPGDPQVAAFYGRLLERVRSVPGIDAAGLVATLPFGGLGNDNGFAIRERPSSEATRNVTADFREADAGYFDTLRIPLRRGRTFTAQEARDGARVVIISELFARRFFDGDEPLGKHLVLDRYDFEIVGVVGDVLHRGVHEPPYQTMYVPTLARREMQLAVRTRLDMERVVPALRTEVFALDPNLPVSAARTMEDRLASSLRQRRVATSALGFFAAMALLMAGLGVYGVVAQSVADRTREIGVRTALGAAPRDILRLIVGQGALLAAGGVVLGLPAALAAAQAARALLFEVSPHDPAAFAATAAVLAVVSLLACLAPARRASGTDAAVALRAE